MLMGCRMENHFRTMGCKYTIQAGVVAHVGDDRLDGNTLVLILEINNRFKYAVFTMSQQNQLRWTPSGNLPA